MSVIDSSRRVLRVLAVAAAAGGLLASCGGGSQVNAFEPQRLLSFGDELSVINSDGYKYSMNSFTDDDGLVCDAHPLWIQYLARQYDMAYPQCNPDEQTDPKARTYAVLGATVESFNTQIQAFQASDSFNSQDMVTVLVGMYDVLDAYSRYPATSEADLRAELVTKGELLGSRVNTLTETGARVLISTIPDLGRTPFAKAETDANTDTNRAELLTRMVDSFNRAMRLKLINDGSKIGLLLADDMTRAMVRVPENYSLKNTKDPVCTVDLPYCTTKTMVTDANASTYLWADELRPSAPWQLQLGVQAVNRTETNPF